MEWRDLERQDWLRRRTKMPDAPERVQRNAGAGLPVGSGGPSRGRIGSGRCCVTQHHAARREFVPQAKRWVVERFFGWINHFRRLSKHDEGRVETTEAWLYAAMTYLLLRCLARAQ